jgi:D-alanyl-D-alanine carboxypeptidase/D-alanyl-D-alanine-endopeptidase (penicillin-binding protein 4)
VDQRDFGGGVYHLRVNAKCGMMNDESDSRLIHPFAFCTQHFLQGHSRMKNAWRLLLVVAGIICLLSRPSRADLESDIQAVLRDKLLEKGSVGVVVVELGAEAGGDRILYTHNASRPFMPASNMKVVTTSTALDLLGADFRFRTLLVRHDQDLILVGDGDPTFGDVEMLKKAGWGTTTVFQNWAEQLKKAGVSSIGNVKVDDSVFDLMFVHPHWPTDQEQARYVAQVAGVALNANCVDFYIHPTAAGRAVGYRLDPPTQYIKVQNTCLSGGENAVWLTRQLGTNDIVLRGTCPAASQAPVSITVHDPALFAATVLSETLGAVGIKAGGAVLRDRSVRMKLAKKEAGYTVLAVHETPLVQVLARANKDSMNLYAESLCKRSGFAASGQSGSWADGTAAAAAFLKKTGVGAAEFQLDDGCGLSRENRVSVNTLMHVLQHNFHGRNREVFLNSLAVGGVDGTLDGRFHEPQFRGRVMAKTGYIATVSALSGYLKVGEDRWYAFSILMNDLSRGSNSKAKALQEAIVKAVFNDAKRSR